jgi:MFS family permease
MWYRRYEAQKRYSAFGCSTILAGAFGGLLASALGKMDGIGGYGGWRWVFIIEGAATCLMAVIVFFALPDFPQDCKWLTQSEFEFLRDRAARENGTLSPSTRMRWLDILHVFKDCGFLGSIHLVLS